MNTDLNYILIKPRQVINLNLFEAEKYEPAVVVQQLIGTLVYYSNFGRYEARLAEKWEKLDEKTWEFTLKNNLKCENGERINSDSFKKSLERSLYIFDKKGGVPILSSLLGYSEFIQSNVDNKDIYNLKEINGIESKNGKLIFKFDKKINSGFLQILSFSPFGYICEKNLTAAGDWADNLKFISSGPYISSEIVLGKKYILKRNPYWLDYSKNSPSVITFSHDDSIIKPTQPTIIDAFTNEYINEKLAEYKLVPEYLNSILLGNFDGFFKSKENRKKFKEAFDQTAKDILPLNFGVNTRSNSFYPNQKKQSENKLDLKSIEIPIHPLQIEGSIPIEGTSRWYAWQVLKTTLEKLNYKYQFVNNEATFENMTSLKYDIRIRGSSIGGGVEAWGLFVSFCSSMGIRFPDPNNVICKLIEKYEDGALNDTELSTQFLENVEEESAILPVSHYGVKLLISPHLKSDSFSPLLSIMKFDQIEIE